MSIIEVKDLVKTYKIIEKDDGIKGYFKNLIKPQYNEFIAVKEINFNIEEGELVGYIGEMGFALVVGIATFIICSLFWSITLPVSFINFLLFIIVILLGIPITFFFTMIAGTVGFYSSSIWGMQILRKSIISIFSGLIAPITLFPIWFQNIANILPFKELIYTPINIWLGQITISEIAFVIMKQVLWIVILYVIAKLFFNHAVKKVTINGG